MKSTPKFPSLWILRLVWRTHVSSRPSRFDTTWHDLTLLVDSHGNEGKFKVDLIGNCSETNYWEIRLCWIQYELQSVSITQLKKWKKYSHALVAVTGVGYWCTSDCVCPKWKRSSCNKKEMLEERNSEKIRTFCASRKCFVNSTSSLPTC